METNARPGAMRWQRVTVPGLIALAVLVQVQFTLQIGAAPIRINAADAALAVLSPAILSGLFRNGECLRRRAGSKLLIAFAAATLALTVALVIGYNANGMVTPWAAIKYAGWYILLGYMAVGMLIAATFTRENIERFVFAFVLFQAGTIFLFMLAKLSGWKLFVADGPRFAGYVANPNAMGVYLLCGVALAFASLDQLAKRRFRIMFVAASVLIAGILYTNSVSALLALICMLVFSGFLNVPGLRRLLQICLLAAAVWVTPQFLAQGVAIGLNVFEKFFSVSLPGHMPEASSRMGYLEHATLELRIEGYREAYTLWRANPVLGAGLGTQLHQKKKTNSAEFPAQQIHSTPLWLLAETGLVGFAAFSGLFVTVFLQIWRLARPPDSVSGHGSAIASAAVLFIAGWIVMSLFHELMYQRVVWLLAGMALAMPIAETNRDGAGG